jgi:hypothetical protein
MDDSAGQNIDAHIQALEGEPQKLLDSMGNDEAHLEPR